MVKQLITLLISFSFLSSSFSQITGSVLTPEGTPAEYATILLNQVTDSTMVKAGYTDLDGNYKLNNITGGQYFLEVSFVGFDTYRSENFQFEEGGKYSAEAVILTVTSEQLDEIVIKARKPLVEVKPDRTVFNVEGSINATGNTALELLRKAPGVVVDNNDNVILQGKSGVTIYINNKPSYLNGDDLSNYLKSMQSSEIEAIEVITNPSSKYDAEGNAGIINIRLKRNKSHGTNASINAGYQIGTFAKYNSSVSLNSRNEHTGIFASYGMNRGMFYNFKNFYREQNSWQLTQKGSELSDNMNQNFRAGLDYYLGKKSTIGIMANGYFGKPKHTSNIRSEIATLEDGQIQQVLRASNKENGTRENLNFNVNYQFDSQKGSTFNVDADYGTFSNMATSNQPNAYYSADESTLLQENNFTSQKPTKIDIYTFKMDYERPLLGGKFGIGLKYSNVQTDNTYDFAQIVEGKEVKDLDRSNSFSYLENVNAGYLSYQAKKGKWALQAGLRAEQTHSEGVLTAFKDNADDEVIRDYFNLFPSIGLTYQLNEKNGLRMSYSRRIDRPKYQDLNPFEFQLDELTFQKGNAFLKPQYTDQIQLTHTFNYSLNTSFSYSHTNDLMAQITDKDATNEQAGFITHLNVADQKIYSLTVSYPFSVAKWWDVYSNINAYHLKNKGDFGAGKTLDLSANVLSLYTQSTFSLSKEFSLELSGFYNSPAIWEGSFETTSMWSIDAGLQKKFLDGRMNVKLSVSDIFNTQQWDGFSTFGGFYFQGNGGWESRRFKMNISYLLGSNSVKSTRKRNTGLEDETNRIK